MIRVFLDHEGKHTELPVGDILVGRGLRCGVRFNDQGVSREHFRVVVDESSATLHDLGSKNGTQINGRKVKAPHALADGDRVTMGRVLLRVLIYPAAGMFDEDTITAVPTRDGLKRRSRLSTLSDVNCPRCRALVPADRNQCSRCGYTWTARRPASHTQELPRIDNALERREQRRRSVEIPMIYRSSSLVTDATASDISRGGLFVACEQFDPIGTTCIVTLLPDGAPAACFDGVVRHVMEQPGVISERPGMGVEFVKIDVEAMQWLVGQLRVK